MKTRAFNVFQIDRTPLGSVRMLIDIVFYQEKNPIAVKKSLIQHDGYPENIWVTRRRLVEQV